MRGKIKIFYSYIAGAGKTYAMLEAAHELKEEGHDVVIGYIEPHTRPDTMAIVSGIEIIEPARVDYKNLELLDLDLDAVIARKPEYVLIDELAHTNAAGMRHTKRYQDIATVLDAGINVFTTLNIQHLVSLQDVVQKVAKISVSETLPDYIFDDADQVEIVDIEPSEIHERLLAGKIYASAKVDKAIENFFSAKKLSALREIALRRGAARLSEANKRNQVSTNETVLACVSTSQDNGRVIRSAARIAKALKADFYAIYVETDAYDELDNKQKDAINNDLKLAKNLGAQIEQVQGLAVAPQIIEYANMIAANKIVMGRSQRPWWKTSKTVADKVTEALPSVEIHIIPVTPKSKVSWKTKLLQRLRASLSVSTLLWSILIMGLTIGIAGIFSIWGASKLAIIAMILTGVLSVAFFAPSIIYPIGAMLIAILAYNFFFVAPVFTFNIDGYENIVHYLLMTIITIFASIFTTLMRRTSRVANRSSARMTALLKANRRFAMAKTEPEVFEALSKLIEEVLGEPAKIYLPTEIEKATDLSPKEQAIAKWTMESLHSAGRGIDTLPDSNITCFPIHTNNFLAGIVVLRNSNIGEAQRHALKAILSEAAAFIQKIRLLQVEQDHRAQAEKERLKLILLRGVSHDMRTPLAVIEGAADTLLRSAETGQAYGGDDKQLLCDIRNEAQEMTRTIDNLLGMTKLTSSAFTIQRKPEILEDVVETAIEKCLSRRGERTISLKNPEISTVVWIDSRLVVQVVVNLLDNAIKHTRYDGAITVSVNQTDQWVQLKIQDDGSGIAPEVLPHIFEDFFTADSAQNDSHRGIGLGLGICRAVVSEHGGHMFARNVEGGGAVVGFAMPKHIDPVPQLSAQPVESTPEAK